ncbi:hypothetical protein O988_08912 [Pseudogymnoascus sp. VKM F-3808]|nr:hypothetical protein O988_08912 [Pseudogymnoascus sp. VKM F-3808]
MYTRVYSRKSAGRLVSGKGQTATFLYPKLSETTLKNEFRNHARKWQQTPTALVSCSVRIVDTVRRAFEIHNEDGELLADIWIAFIEIPTTKTKVTKRIHSAETLAEKCDLSEPQKLRYEFVFEWAIPKKYLVHKVSLQTLVDRGLRQEDFCKSNTAEVRYNLAKTFQRNDAWDIGVSLGAFAKTFGARAPVNWIAHQLFYDCARSNIVYEDEVEFWYKYKKIMMAVDLGFLRDLDDGITTSLNDCWLASMDFFQAYEELKDKRDIIEDAILWELVEFWETWYDIDEDGLIIVLSAKEIVLYERAKNKLLDKHEKMWAAIEPEAVKLGL